VPETCCKTCGSVHMHEKRGHWGPHQVRVTCQDCGRFVKWGAVHKEVKRIDAYTGVTVGKMLKAIDAELKEAGDRLGLHWGFYTEPYDRADDPLRARHAEPWPDQIVVIVRGGDNEGWMVELWGWAGVGSERRPTDRVGMAKIISSRDDAFEYARLVSIAAGVL